MGWFFRAIELADGQWACRHGRHVYDTHSDLSEALCHLRDLASAVAPAELFIHRLDGSIEHLGSA